MHHYGCIAPNTDISLQSGRFWATFIASSRERLLDFMSYWIVFIHVVQGRTGGLLRLSKLLWSWHLFHQAFMQYGRTGKDAMLFLLCLIFILWSMFSTLFYIIVVEVRCYGWTMVCYFVFILSVCVCLSFCLSVYRVYKLHSNNSLWCVCNLSVPVCRRRWTMSRWAVNTFRCSSQTFRSVDALTIPSQFSLH